MKGQNFVQMEEGRGSLLSHPLYERRDPPLFIRLRIVRMATLHTNESKEEGKKKEEID